MSETNTAPVGVEAPPIIDGANDDNYQSITKQLSDEGMITEDDDDPDLQDEPELPEGIPAKDKLKVNGKTIEKSYSEIKEMAQKYEATTMKLETAKKEITEARQMKEGLTKQTQAVKDLMVVLQTGDFDRLSEFVHDVLKCGDVFDKKAVDYVLKVWNHSKMPPEQQEAIRNKKLIERYKAEEETRRNQEQERANQYHVNQWSQHIDIEIPKALKVVGLPDSEFVRDHVIQQWRAALERGQNPTATAVVAYVKKRLEDAKIANFTVPKAIAPQRPRATAASVGLKTQQQETGYKNWDDWKKTRGR